MLNTLFYWFFAYILNFGICKIFLYSEYGVTFVFAYLALSLFDICTETALIYFYPETPKDVTCKKKAKIYFLFNILQLFLILFITWIVSEKIFYYSFYKPYQLITFLVSFIQFMFKKENNKKS